MVSLREGGRRPCSGWPNLRASPNAQTLLHASHPPRRIPRLDRSTIPHGEASASSILSSFPPPSSSFPTLPSQASKLQHRGQFRSREQDSRRAPPNGSSLCLGSRVIPSSSLAHLGRRRTRLDPSLPYGRFSFYAFVLPWVRIRRSDSRARSGIPTLLLSHLVPSSPHLLDHLERQFVPIELPRRE